MFTKDETQPKKNLLAGIDMTPLAWGDQTMLVRFDLQKGSQIPEHEHIYEQTGFLVTGRMRLTIGDQTYDAAGGDSWSIPAHTVHNAEALDDCMAIEVFSPPRKDYMP